MKPDIGSVLLASIETLTTEIAPHFDGDYRGGTVSSIAVLMSLLGNEYDRAADMRFTTNKEIKEIFANAFTHLSDSDLALRLKNSSELEEISLRITDLDRSSALLKNLLIELHLYVEDLSEPWAEKINKDIWAFLGRDAQPISLGDQ
ncbi:MAG: hypothetical protein ACI89U_000824 [Gammaproteobacteria bacterium]|jgi:hypothetical protein